MTPLIQKLVSYVPDVAEQMHWFDMSGCVNEPCTVDAKYIIDNPMPYDKCALVGDEGKLIWMILLSKESNHITVQGHSLSYDGEHKVLPLVFYKKDQYGDIVYKYDGQPEHREFALKATLTFIILWMQKLNFGYTAYKAKSHNKHINNKRIAKGKKLLFNWHTVTIGPRAERSIPGGETHASPRAHDRRGHWRKHKENGHVWVKPCRVGDAGLGVIFKDYVLKP